jgi:hypothetical protein
MSKKLRFDDFARLYKSVDLFVWLRLGDASTYEKHDDISSVVLALQEVGVKGPLSGGVLPGHVYAEGFKGLNYISLFWGDKDCRFVKDLTEKDFKQIESELGKGKVKKPPLKYLHCKGCAFDVRAMGYKQDACASCARNYFDMWEVKKEKS